MPLFFSDASIKQISLVKYLLYGYTACQEVCVAKQKQQTPEQRRVMTGMERLVLRVSSMINHPLAQTQRWVTIHQLDTDGDQDWEEVMGMLAETPELEMTFDDDGSVTLRWEADESETSTLVVEGERVGEEEVAAPF